MPRILTIEDDPATGQEIVAELQQHGMTVEWIRDGREGLVRAAAGEFDAVTLDRMLPNVDGLTIVSVMRNAGLDTPVLMISALSDVDERVRGLRAGGDDYMTKPFASEEMAARLEVLLRRKAKAQTPTRLTVGDLGIDQLTRRVFRGESEIRLNPTEYRLLEYMVRNAGQVLTRTMIFEAVWEYHFDPGTNLIEVHLGRLRRKLDLLGLPPLIHTMRGTGYVIRAPD